MGHWTDNIFHKILAELSLESFRTVPVVDKFVVVDGVPGSGCGGESQTDVWGDVEGGAVAHPVPRHRQRLRQGTAVYPGHFPVKLSSQSREPQAELHQLSYRQTD